MTSLGRFWVNLHKKKTGFGIFPKRAIYYKYFLKVLTNTDEEVPSLLDNNSKGRNRKISRPDSRKHSRKNSTLDPLEGRIQGKSRTFCRIHKANPLYISRNSKICIRLILHGFQEVQESCEDSIR